MEPGARVQLELLDEVDAGGAGGRKAAAVLRGDLEAHGGRGTTWLSRSILDTRGKPQCSIPKTPPLSKRPDVGPNGASLRVAAAHAHQEDKGRSIVGVGGARQPEAIAAPYVALSKKRAVITGLCFLFPLA